jgi:hypothetical protein
MPLLENHCPRLHRRGNMRTYVVSNVGWAASLPTRSATVHKSINHPKYRVGNKLPTLRGCLLYTYFVYMIAKCDLRTIRQKLPSI